MERGATPRSTSRRPTSSTKGVDPAHEDARHRRTIVDERTAKYALERRAIDATADIGRTTRGLARSRDDPRERHVPRFERGQFVDTDEVGPAAHAVDQRRWHAWCDARPFAQHREQRRDARSARHQQQRAAQLRGPHEGPAERPAQFEDIAHADLVVQERRDLAIGPAVRSTARARRCQVPRRSNSCAAPRSRPRPRGGHRRAGRHDAGAAPARGRDS